MRCLEQQGMYESLRQVAAQLTLPNVEFLGEQAGRTARGAVALEPADGCQIVALLVVRQRHQEAAQQEGSFGIA